MLFRRPCYFDRFNCTADKCTDNCCIGWEICIDSDTFSRYKAVIGEFGQRLKESITPDDEPCFVLKDERCPFLNKKNLCDIISTLGEDYLCQICRDHPRWFEWYGNEKEGGIGLSCEEGARLILCEENFADYFESEVDDYPDEDFDSEAYAFLLSVRDRIFDILCENEGNFAARADLILKICSKAEAALNKSEIQPSLLFDFNSELKKALPILAKTEPVNENWTAFIDKLKTSTPHLAPDSDEEKYLIRLFAYFVWRYFLTSVFDYRVKEKVCFGLFSATVIFALYASENSKGFSPFLKSAVLYSKQMEYSAENLDIFFDNIESV